MYTFCWSIVLSGLTLGVSALQILLYVTFLRTTTVPVKPSKWGKGALLSVYMTGLAHAPLPQNYQCTREVKTKNKQKNPTRKWGNSHSCQCAVWLDWLTSHPDKGGQFSLLLSSNHCCTSNSEGKAIETGNGHRQPVWPHWLSRVTRPVLHNHNRCCCGGWLWVIQRSLTHGVGVIWDEWRQQRFGRSINK